MAETVQKNFRMSAESIKLLHSVARAQGITETEVVEICVSKYAREIGHDVERAGDLLFAQICGATAKTPIDAARVYVSKNVLVSLDRLAERSNTTRGKLVESLIQAAQAREQVTLEGSEGRKGREGREGRKGAGVEAEAAQSAAGDLAAMAGENWGETKTEKEKGKRKT